MCDTEDENKIRASCKTEEDTAIILIIREENIGTKYILKKLKYGDHIYDASVIQKFQDDEDKAIYVRVAVMMNRRAADK